METVTLYFRQGSSDKIYQAAIEPRGVGFVVTFAYGRRGSTLNTGTKTQSPVSHAEAKAIYDKLVKEKTAKGYTPGADGTPYQQTEKAEQATGIHCQLLNPIDEEQVGKFIEDPAYWMQEKRDGRRLLIRKQNRKVIGINKLGLAVALPDTLVLDANRCDMDFTLMGKPSATCCACSTRRSSGTRKSPAAVTPSGSFGRKTARGLPSSGHRSRRNT